MKVFEKSQNDEYKSFVEIEKAGYHDIPVSHNGYDNEYNLVRSKIDCKGESN